MSAFNAGNFRRPDKFLKRRVSKRNIKGLDTSDAIDNELWSALEYYSEIQDVGLNFLKRAGISNLSRRKKIYKLFQANVRQAKSFYYAAKELQPRSASLLYFYCFENLAEAALDIYNPGLTLSHHGLSPSRNNRKDFQKEGLIVWANGTFPEFYNWWFGAQINKTSLKIAKLLPYCTDVSYQCSLASIGESKILTSYSACCISSRSKTSWPLVGIPRTNLILQYPKSFSYFLANFEEVDVPATIYERIFDILATERSHLKFFQGVNEQPWLGVNTPNLMATQQEVLKAFENSFQENYFADKFDFAISLPYLQKKQIRLNEPTSIYLIMFYLSDLVRYKPHYLEGLLNKKEAWLIDSFVRSCPVTFLRGVTSRIIDTDLVVKNR